MIAVKRIFALASALGCLLLLLGLCAAAEGYDTPRDAAVSYIRVCMKTLAKNPAAPEADAAFPELLEQIGDCLNADSAAAADLRNAVLAIRRRDMDSAQGLLQSASWRLREEDVRTPFGPRDLPAAVKYGLLPLEDVDGFITAFSEKARAVTDSFTLVCPGQLREQMLGGVSYEYDTTLLSDLSSQCGIYNFRYSYNDDCGFLSFFDIVYYPGVRIVHAWRTGGTDRLTGDEVQAMNAALEIASAADGTQLQRERQIHDALCERITYHTFPGNSFERKDCAIGALLDGQADCDGYSDAFYLCGSLAGLRVRFMHGDSIRKPEEEASDDASLEQLEEQREEIDPEGMHMWNLICVDGSWVSVDVTWDDGDPGILYENYNLGSENIGLTHTWDARTQVVPMEPALRNELRDPTLAVSFIQSWDGLYEVCRAMAADRPERFFVAYPQALDAGEAGELISNSLYSTGVEHYSWYHQNAILEILNLEYAANFAICDSAEAAADYIETCAAGGVRDFKLFFSPALSRQMFADDRAAISRLLSESTLASTAYAYNAEYGRVVVSNAEYHQARNAVADLDDLRSLLREAMLAGQSETWFIMPDGMDFDAVSEDVSNTIHSCGVDNYTWSVTGKRVTITDVIYADNFKICDTVEEAASYIETCAAGKVRNFRLYFAPSLAPRMFADEFAAIYELLSVSSLKEITFSYNEAQGMLAFSDAEYYAVRNFAGSLDDIRGYLRQALAARQDGAWFIMPDWMDFETISGDVSNAIYSMGVDTFYWSVRGRRVTISGAVYYPEFALVSNAGELKAYLETCRTRNLAGFRAYCPPELYGAMVADSSSAFFKLLKEVGCHVETVYHNESTGALIVENAAW